MEAEHLALVSYGEMPVVWHTRVLLSRVSGNNWIILTPDHARYEDLLDVTNPDYDDFEYLGASNAIPARIPAGSVYGFAPLAPGELARQMMLAKLEAEALRLQQSLGAPAPPMPGVPVAPPVQPAPMPPPPGFLGPGPAAQTPLAPSPAACWVTIESGGTWKKGDVIVVEPAPLPPGTLVLGDRAVLVDPTLQGQGIFLGRVPHSQAPTYQLEDFRVLLVQFDAQGTRRKDFSSAVPLMVDGSPMGGGLQLESPSTALNAKSLRDQNLTPTTYHEFWLRNGDIPRGDRSIYEHDCLESLRLWSRWTNSIPVAFSLQSWWSGGCR